MEQFREINERERLERFPGEERKMARENLEKFKDMLRSSGASNNEQQSVAGQADESTNSRYQETKNNIAKIEEKISALLERKEKLDKEETEVLSRENQINKAGLPAMERNYFKTLFDVQLQDINLKMDSLDAEVSRLENKMQQYQLSLDCVAGKISSAQCAEQIQQLRQKEQIEADKSELHYFYMNDSLDDLKINLIYEREKRGEITTEERIEQEKKILDSKDFNQDMINNLYPKVFPEKITNSDSTQYEGGESSIHK